MIETVRMETQEVWYMGHLIEEKEVPIYEDHGFKIPEPLPGQRGQFAFADRVFTVVRDDDTTFWDGMTREEWFLELKLKNIRSISQGELNGWWDVDEQGNPQQLAQKVSIADMVAQNKTLMAHLMVDLGFFSSVGQAKKNGWDKPLELGRHVLGPKKKRAFVEIIP